MSGAPPPEAWRRNQRVMVATVFVVFTGFAFVLPFLPLYVRQLGVHDDGQVALWSGLIIGVAPLLAGLLAPLWGRLGDRYGRKPVAVLALAAYVLLLALSAFVRTPAELLALRVGVGLCGGIGPLSLAMATAEAPREHTGHAVGLVQSAQILSAAVGPFAGGLLADLVGIRATFLATAALCAVALVLVATRYEERREACAEPSRGGGSFRDLLAVAGVLPLIATLFFVNFVGRSLTPILPLLLQELGIAEARLAFSTGALISLYAVAAAASAALLGRATRRRSPLGLLALSLVGGAAATLPMAFVGSYAGFLALAALLGLVSGGTLTLCYTIGGLLVPGERRATAFGFFAGAALFGGAVAPSVAGLLAPFDLRAILYVNTALYAALVAGVVAARAGWRAAEASAAEPA
jgi:DHA1 family multidrug resistance protein-like MFS transporter